MPKTISHAIFMATLTIVCWHAMADHVESVNYYVEPGCGNITTYNPATRACTGGSKTSRTTVSAGIALLTPGDTLYVRGGTPANPTIYEQIFNVPSGAGAAARVVISAYPINRTCSGHNPIDPTTCIGSTYETVMFQGVNTGSAVVQLMGLGAASPGGPATRQWITIEGLIIDGSRDTDNGVTITGGGLKATNFPACDNGSHGVATTPHHLRFLNNEIRNAGNQGFLGELWNSHIEIIGNWVHHNGRDANSDHGLYMGGSNNWIVGNLIEHNKRYGIHLYTQPTGTPTSPLCDPYSVNNLIERNIVRGNSTGIGILRGSIHSTVRNNLVYGNSREGIFIASGTTGVNKIYHNTAVINGTQSLFLADGADNSLVKNNIYKGFFQDPLAFNVTFANNYSWCDTCAPPNFVDAPSHDYRLQAGDARINAGANLTSEGVTIDFDGNARPVGGRFDIGAFEFDSSGPPVQTFDYSLSTDDEALTIVQGASDVVTVTVARLAGTAADVAFTATGLPTNVTISVDPTSCTPTPTTCTTDVTITVPNTTPQGTFAVTVRGVSGSGAGALTRTVTLTLAVICN